MCKIFVDVTMDGTSVGFRVVVQRLRNLIRQQSQPQGTQPSSIERVEAYGNVDIRTAEEVVRGDRAVYNPNSGLARLLGAVRITRGDNTLTGQEAIVNMKTGVARLVSAPGARVQGLVVPQQGQPQPGPQPSEPAR